MFDALEFYNDNGVKYTTEGKHSRHGWVQIKCPFCTGNPGNHLGFNTHNGYYACWRCGWHTNIEVIHTLLNVSWGKAKSILKEYSSIGSSYQPSEKTQKRTTTIKVPSNGPFGPSYIRYLERRNFDPYDLIKKWDLRAGGPYGEQKHRIIAPIVFNNKIVSYTGRDITGKSKLRYKACKAKNEIILHKNILYGIDHAQRSCILVEGITDVWRLGYGAVATFGISTKPPQIFLLAECFQKIFIMFDEDKTAQKAAEKIAWDLSMTVTETEICLIKGDPGDLPQDEADLYKRQLLG